MHKLKTLILITSLSLSLSMLLSACQTDKVKTQTPESQGDSTTTMDAELNKETSPEEVAEVSETLAQVQRSFASHESGSDPDPESAFAKLDKSEQEDLVAWLDTVATTYQNISEDFKKFASQSPDISDLQTAQQKLGDTEAFQELKRQVQEALEKVKKQGEDLTAESLSALKNAAFEMSQWYEEFLQKLSELDLQGEDLGEKLNSDLDSAMQYMQKFLDELTSFTN